MTCEELIEELKKYPPDAVVVIDYDNYCDIRNIHIDSSNDEFPPLLVLSD